MRAWPGFNEWLFAARTFAAAMLAVYVALSVGLDRPYWAMATVYIVSQPLSGSLRSKAVYRLLGTLIGAAATVMLVPNLVDAPELLSLALALWTGICLYLALLDRTPRSYVFMLGGYTAALIGFPSVTTPGQIWDIALARVEEIWLGIACATVVGSVVFPRPLGPILTVRILDWVSNVSAWAEDALGRDLPAAADGARRLALAADAVELRLLTTQLAYDTSKEQAATMWVVELERRMVLLLPLLSSVTDRMAALCEAGGITPGLARLLAELRLWVRAGAPPPRSEAERLREEIAALQAETDPRRGWNEVMRASLLLRLREIVDVRQDLRDLRRHIAMGGGPLAAPLAYRIDAPARQHRDRGIALLSGLSAFLTILAICAFWIGTGWPDGAGAAQLGAVACCLFATLDDPTPAQKKFMFAAVLGLASVGVGLFGVLPLVHDFETLAFALGVFFVPVGVMMAVPATQPLGTAIALLTATLLAVQSTYAADFPSYANGGIASLLGLGGAAVMTALVRSVGAEWSARRLLRAIWRDLAAIPRHPYGRDRASLSALLLDRLGLLVPRLAAVGQGNELAAVDALRDLRIGINMADLQAERPAISAPLRAAVDDVLFGAASHFAAQAALRQALPPPPPLLGAIDRALDAALAAPAALARDLLVQLVGIRRGLFAQAPPYRPAPAPDAQPSIPAAAAA
jgi:uncharacterized membrane protein YccC